MRLPLTCVLAAAALLLAAGCSDSDESPAPAGSTPRATATPTANPDAENDLAKTYLLTINEFPTGWVENPQEDTDSEVAEKCSPASGLPGRSGGAISGDFGRGAVAELTNIVVLFPTAEGAQAGVGHLEDWLRCVAGYINDGNLDDKAAKYGGAKVGAVSFPAHGDEARAVRLSMEATGEGQRIDFYADLVIVRKGRVLTAVYAVDALSPFSTDELVTLVEKAVAKLP